MKTEISSNFPKEQNLLQYSYKEEDHLSNKEIGVKDSIAYTEENAFQDMVQRPQGLSSTKNIQLQTLESQNKFLSNLTVDKQQLQQKEEQYAQRTNKLKSQYEDMVQQQQQEIDEIKHYEQKYQDALDLQRDLERQLENKKLELSLIKKENQNSQQGVIQKLQHKIKILQDEKISLLDKISQQKIIHEQVTTEITNVYQNNKQSQMEIDIKKDIQSAQSKIKNLEEQLKKQQQKKNSNFQKDQIKNETLEQMEQKLDYIDKNLNFLKNNKNCKCKQKDLTLNHLQNTLTQLERPIQTVIYEKTYDTYHDCVNSLRRLSDNNHYYRSSYTRTPSPVYTVNTSYHYPRTNIFDNTYQNKQYYSSMTGACADHDWFVQSKDNSIKKYPSINSENLIEHSYHNNEYNYVNRTPRYQRVVEGPRIRRLSRSRSSYRNIQEPEVVHETRRISQIRTSSPVRDYRYPLDSQRTVRTVVTNFLDNQNMNQLENNSYKDFQFQNLDFQDEKNISKNSLQDPFNDNGDILEQSQNLKFQSFGKQERNFKF